MSFRKYLLTSFFGFAAFASAATVSLTPSPNANVLTSSGQPGQAGWLVQVGFFKGWTSSQTQIDSLSDADKADVYSYISGNFVPLGAPGAPIFASNAIASAGYGDINTFGIGTVGAAAVPTATGGATGVTLTSNPANSLSAGGLARGTRLFLLIYNAPTADAATELGVFSASTWTVGATATNVSLATTSIDTAAEAYRGAIGSLRLAPLNVVPEPSTSLMALLAGMGLVARRRR
jgi:hypothetical protein